MHASTAYDQGYEDGIKGLSPTPSARPDTLDQSIYLDGYNDASREIVQMLTARLLGPSARCEVAS